MNKPFSSDLHKQACTLFTQGYGYKAAASRLGLNRNTVREWYFGWRATGMTNQLKCEAEQKSQRTFSEATRLAAVRDKLSGDTTIDVMSRYGLSSKRLLNQWVEKYRNCV